MLYQNLEINNAGHLCFAGQDTVLLAEQHGTPLMLLDEAVIRSGVTGWNQENHQTIEYKLTLDSNPQFTASVLVACARAAMRMSARGMSGCQTIFNIAPADLSPLSQDYLLSHML